MKHFLLKFNHGVEIGARLAYIGHFKRTKDSKINFIAYDELRHRHHLEQILKYYDQEPNPIIDAIFWSIGGCIGWACQYSPLWSLNWVARIMELFAISNYVKLATVYPAWNLTLYSMAANEKDHEEYFRLGSVRYKHLQDLRASLVGGNYGSK